MTGAKSGLPDLDMNRVHALLVSELAAFRQEFDSEFSERQEQRGSLILWFAAFLPEAFAPAFIEILRDAVFVRRSHPGYRGHNWYRVLKLEVALFALTGDYQYLETAIPNINHGKSSVRDLVLLSLAMIADRLEASNYALQIRIASNLEAQNMYSDEAVVLFAVTKGSSEEKLKVLREWLAKYGDQTVGGVLTELAKGREDLVPNPFQDEFLWILEYICVRLLERPEPERKAEPPIQTCFPFEGESRPLTETLLARMKAHPLMQSHLTIKET